MKPAINKCLGKVVGTRVCGAKHAFSKAKLGAGDTFVPSVDSVHNNTHKTHSERGGNYLLELMITSYKTQQ